MPSIAQQFVISATAHHTPCVHSHGIVQPQVAVDHSVICLGPVISWDPGRITVAPMDSPVNLLIRQ